MVRARDTRTGQAVALKLLAPELAGEPQWQRRFAREAAALQALNHPGIVKLLETGQARGLSYFTMKLIDGENLRQRMSRERPTVAESVAWAAGILDALGAAHAAGFLHGDLKPENVIVDRNGVICLLDFGLTRPIAPNLPATQTLSAVTGTVQYLSPERIAGSEPDVRSDLFSVGVLLHEFLTGKTPFARPNPLATAAAILHEQPGELPAGIPVGLAAVLKRCLQKDAALRPASAVELARALDDAMLTRRETRRPARLLAAAAFAVVVLALVSWWVFRGALAARPVRLTVPAATDIWLAGQPAGAKVSGLFGTDSVPLNAPVQLAVIPGHVLSFSASGSVSVNGECFAPSPDGGCYPEVSPYGAGPANGISRYEGPASALIGVFVNTRVPSGGAAPRPIDFREVQNFQALSPLLNQVFFIGDGLTGTATGQLQRFTVPPGATNLFLAASDSLGSSSDGNSGKFTVTATDHGPRR